MQPLAERMRPRTLDEYVGQAHLVGEEGFLRRAMRHGRLPSFILWGPPGVGKTTLARILASTQQVPFFTLSAIHAGVKDVRDAIDQAKRSRFFDGPNPLLFIDEIHRFSKSQQDSLLGAVEAGIVTLIGATTENPSFEVIPALLSRCQVYVLNPLDEAALTAMVDRALKEDVILQKRTIRIASYKALFYLSGGDGRRLYNLLELLADMATEGESLVIDDALVEACVMENIHRYDKGGEQHYDIASAFIKSIRGSDPNAAVYWLARMIEGGEDVKFIARRMIIAASEDIGLANPNALLMATTAFQAVQVVGWPESRIILSQAAIYLATSPKSNSAYLAIDAALAKIKNQESVPVPLHLRNAPTQLMKNLAYGQGYQYAHDFPGHFIDQQFLPDSLDGHIFYDPSAQGAEAALRARLAAWWPARYKYGKQEE